MEPMEQLRLLSLTASVVGLVAITQAARRHRKRAWYVVPAAIYLSQLGLFNFVRIMDYPYFFGVPLTSGNLNLWSASISLLAAFTIIIKAVLMINGKILGDIDNA